MNLKQAAEIFANLAQIVLKQGGFQDFESAALCKQAVETVKAEAEKQQTAQETNHLEKVN